MPGAASPRSLSDWLYRAVVDTAVDAIIVIDDEGRILSTNAAAERMFGHDAAALHGERIEMLMPEPDRGRHDTYMRRYLTTGERRIIGIGREVTGLRRDGSTFPMDLAVGEAVEGEVRVFVGIIRDVTARQEADRQMHELREELLHVSRLNTMGQMAATLAHELNQPLTAIGNYLQAARRLLAAEGREPGRVEDAIERAAQQATRAGQVIRRLREFVAKGDTERRFENLNRVVEEATALALIGARHEGVQTVLTFDPAVPPAMIDRVQIQQVVLNLVRNAVEAMEGHERRELVVATRLRAEAGLAETLIVDSGPGLAPEVADRLFQPFVSTKANGMGLGLSICREIVESHGGHLTAAPNPGGGTVFRFTLRCGEGRGADDDA